jgi:hypothetical protein
MNTFTTQRPKARLLALVVGVCALAVPANASAFYGEAANSGRGAADDNIARNAGLVAPDHTSLNASLNSPATAEPDGGSSPTGAVDQSPGYASLNAISGAPASEPTLVSGSPSSVDSFDWGDAALGAGVTMALITLGGVALVTVRRRTAVSPTA